MLGTAAAEQSQSVECSNHPWFLVGRPNIFQFLKFKCSACDCQEQNNLEI